MKRAAILLLLSAGTASALSIEAGSRPAEQPPASYKGQTYVDSRGCVYVRAGFGGRTTWIPRVGADRKVICGVKPTFATQTATVATAPASAPRPPAAPKPAPSSLSPAPKPETAAAQPATAPARRTAVAPRPAPEPSSLSPEPAAEAETAAASAPAAPRISGTVHATCDAETGTANVPFAGRTVRLRCAPGMTRARTVTLADSSGNGTRVVLTPARQGDAAETKPARGAPAASVGSPPKGYKLVWGDDRLNPYRAQGTANGQRLMQLMWTESVPRRLVDAKTGWDLTRTHSKVHPLAQGQTDDAETDLVVSSKSVPPQVTRRPAPPPAGNRYVQVGTFGVPENARKTADRLAALGLPARIGRTARYQIVMAGPFASQTDLTAALAKVRRAGFKDAFVKR